MLVVILECLQTCLTGIFMNTNPHVYISSLLVLSIMLILPLQLCIRLCICMPYILRTYNISLFNIYIYIFKCASMHIQITFMNKHQCKVTSFKTLIIYSLMPNSLHSRYVQNDLMDRGSISRLKTHLLRQINMLYTLMCIY